MDHGLLNIPLSKRGDINVQLDRFKADQAAEKRRDEKARSAQSKLDKAEAKRLVAEATDDQIRGLATRLGLTLLAMRKKLNAEAHWQPKLIIKFLSVAA